MYLAYLAKDADSNGIFDRTLKTSYSSFLKYTVFKYTVYVLKSTFFTITTMK